MTLPPDYDQSVSDKWQSATEIFDQEFNITPERVHLLGTIKTLFGEFKDEVQL